MLRATNFLYQLGMRGGGLRVEQVLQRLGSRRISSVIYKHDLSSSEIRKSRNNVVHHYDRGLKNLNEITKRPAIMLAIFVFLSAQTE